MQAGQGESLGFWCRASGHTLVSTRYSINPVNTHHHGSCEDLVKMLLGCLSLLMSKEPYLFTFIIVSRCDQDVITSGVSRFCLPKPDQLPRHS